MGNDKTDWGVMAVIITVGLCGIAYFMQGKDSNEKDIGEKTGEYVTSIKNSLSASIGLKGGSATKRRKKSKSKIKSHKKH